MYFSWWAGNTSCSAFLFFHTGLDPAVQQGRQGGILAERTSLPLTALLENVFHCSQWVPSFSLSLCCSRIDLRHVSPFHNSLHPPSTQGTQTCSSFCLDTSRSNKPIWFSFSCLEFFMVLSISDGGRRTNIHAGRTLVLPFKKGFTGHPFSDSSLAEFDPEAQSLQTLLWGLAVPLGRTHSQG